MTNCPNCGAVINTYAYVKCPYCGTDYFDFAPFDTSKPFYMKIRKSDGKTIICKVVMRSCCISEFPQMVYADGNVISSLCYVDRDIDISLSVVGEQGLIIVDKKD